MITNGRPGPRRIVACSQNADLPHLPFAQVTGCIRAAGRRNFGLAVAVLSYSSRAGVSSAEVPGSGWCGSSLATAWLRSPAAGRSRTLPVPSAPGARAPFRSRDGQGSERPSCGYPAGTGQWPESPRDCPSAPLTRRWRQYRDQPPGHRLRLWSGTAPIMSRRPQAARRRWTFTSNRSSTDVMRFGGVS